MLIQRVKIPNLSPNFMKMVRKHAQHPTFQAILGGIIREPQIIGIAKDFKGTPEADRLFKQYEKMTGAPLASMRGDGPKPTQQEFIGAMIEKATRDGKALAEAVRRRALEDAGIEP